MNYLLATNSGETWMEYGGSFDAPVTWGELLFYIVAFSLAWYFWIRHL
ncbi:MAG: hypothetical protein HC812_13775 [Leptolyngbya sp. RL_3_1]|nr:hypothetical protein [Leptolyngbya sp. RL_3_1]